MRHHRFVGLLLLTSLMLACNFPLFAPAARPTEQPTAVPAVPAVTLPAPSALPTFTSIPVASPTVTNVPTPSTPQVSPISVNVNCRSGPDVAYDAISVLLFGNNTQVAGRSDDSSWWYVHDPTNPGGFCWVSAGVVTLAGPLAGIPVVAAPAAIVTEVTVDVSIPSTVTCGGPNPVTFSATITTNGAVNVKYQWEITGDKSNAPTPEKLNFSAADTKDVPDPGAYSVDCGKYKVTLHVLGPNDISASKTFKVSGP